MIRTISILFTLFGAINLFAQSPEAMSKIETQQVPKEVKEKMSQAHPREKVEQWYLHNDVYAAKTSANGMSSFSKFNQEGLMIEEMLLKSWADAPEALKQGKQKTTYKYWEVTELYEIHQDDKISQYFLVMKNDKNEMKSIYFDPSGKLEGKSNTGY